MAFSPTRDRLKNSQDSVAPKRRPEWIKVRAPTGETYEWLQELNIVFDDFKTQGVSDVVVDLRYNGGGSLDLSAYIASTLGSVTAMLNNDVYVINFLPYV